MLMAGCSKESHTVSSPDPDAWMYDETLPVPIRFGVSNLPVTKAAIDTPADMVGKEFGFFATNSNIEDWKQDSGLEMPQNASATCQLLDNGNVQFNFAGGPYYYPQTSHDNYTFYGYHALRDENFIRDSKDSLFVVVEVGKTDILWAKAKAESFTDDDGQTYEGYNARYIRKSGNQPFMEFKHSTACVTFNARTEKSAYAEANEGKDQVKITGVTVNSTVTQAVLRIALKDGITQDKLGKPITQEGWEGSLRPTNKKDLSATSVVSEVLTETSSPICEDFFLYPSGEGESITITLDYEVISGESGDTAIHQYSSTYELLPEVKQGEMSGKKGFFAGYKYNYNFIVYTPERIGIEATVEPYVSAFGDDGYEDVYPENE